MRPLIAGNWKLHGLARQLGEIGAMASSLSVNPPATDILICLPATLLARAALAVAGRIAVGGQDCCSEIVGAFTGDISAEMLRDAGATAVIVGHSERRQHHQETNALVAAKVVAVWRTGMMAIVCIGETLAQRQAGETLAVCADQLACSTPDDIGTSLLAVAYEPLWAIGSGRTPDQDEIVEVHQRIRQCLVARWGAAAKPVRILYGGSVGSANAHEILMLPEVNGVPVGGESLNVRDFEKICRSVPAGASRIKN
jgi:triosephosphate isomerase (TIM)